MAKYKVIYIGHKTPYDTYEVRKLVKTHFFSSHWVYDTSFRTEEEAIAYVDGEVNPKVVYER